MPLNVKCFLVPQLDSLYFVSLYLDPFQEYRTSIGLSNYRLAVRELDLLTGEETESTIAIVISHDRDLSQPPDVEPAIEVIIGPKVGKVEGNYTFAKNTRRLHLECSSVLAPIWIDISAIGKITHPKNSLLQHDPDSDARLSYEELVILQRWLVARYQRSAFADEFNRRLRSTGVESGLKAISAKFGKYLRAVFFDVDEGRENERNGDKDAYDLVVTLLYDTDNDPEMAEAKAEEARQAIEKLFSEKCRQGWVWETIELRSCEVMADRALSFRDAQSFKEWRSEHVSLKGPPRATIAAWRCSVTVMQPYPERSTSARYFLSVHLRGCPSCGGCIDRGLPPNFR